MGVRFCVPVNMFDDWTRGEPQQGLMLVQRVNGSVAEGGNDMEVSKDPDLGKC